MNMQNGQLVRQGHTRLDTFHQEQMVDYFSVALVQMASSRRHRGRAGSKVEMHHIRN